MAENEPAIVCFVTYVKEEFLKIQLMWMNYLPNHSWNYVDSECVSCVVVDCKGAKFIGNKQTNTQVTLTAIFVY